MIVSNETARRRSAWAFLLLCNKLSRYPANGWSVDYTTTTEIFHPVLEPCKLRHAPVYQSAYEKVADFLDRPSSLPIMMFVGTPKVVPVWLLPNNSPVIFKQN